MWKLRITQLLLICFLFPVLGQAQTQFIFSQPNQTPIQYNPGFAGSLESGRLAMTMRHNIMPGIRGHTTAAVSWDQMIPKLKGGLGVHAFVDYLSLTFSQVGICYAYKKKIGKSWSISPAASLNLGSVAILDTFIVTDPNDPALPETPAIRFYPDLNLGLLLNSSRFYLGISVDHLLQPQVSWVRGVSHSRRYRSYFLQTGYIIKSSPEANWSYTLAGIGSFDKYRILGQANFNVKYKNVIFGTGGSSWGNVIFMGGFQSDRFKVTLSYSLITNGFKAISNGIIEGSGLYYLPTK